MTPSDLESAMNDALDADPGDLATRAEYADWLEDRGRYDDAAGQRWLWRAKKWPTLRKGAGNYAETHPWDWFSERDAAARGSPHAAMPLPMFGWQNRQCRYATRVEAEADAIEYARRNGLLEDAT